MRLTRFDSATAFLAEAGDYLVAREAEHNLALGILGTLRDHPGVYVERPYLAVVRDGGGIALAAIRTPPFALVLSEAGVAADSIPPAIEPLVADLVRRDPALAGVLGPKPVVGSFVARWSSVTGRAHRLELAERIYALSEVIPPLPPDGGWRLAGEPDRALLMAWADAFQREALPERMAVRDLEPMIDRWIGCIGRAAYLWEVGGRPVSLVGVGSPTPNGVRIGPVYTPPGDRGRGYATALTAAASRVQLESGYRLCFLFTDLGNPTSNRIYQAIGYEPVTDIDQYRFDQVGASPPVVDDRGGEP